MTPEELLSAQVLYWQLADSARKHPTWVHKHETLRDAFVLRDNAIPLPSPQTALAWQHLFPNPLWPFPPIHIEGHAALQGSFRPAVYGISPESLLLPLAPSQILYGAHLPRLHQLATSGFHMLSANPEHQASLRPIPIISSEYFVGVTFVFTNPAKRNEWREAHREMSRQFCP